jgi:hypothetical protein
MDALFLLIPITLLILVSLLGTDTRDGRDWQPRNNSTWTWH